VFDLAKYTKDLSELFESSDRILIISHINPDGDAIGSQLALYHYLSYKGKRVDMMCPNNLQEFLKWMDGSGEIKVFIRDRKRCIRMIKEADLIIMVDFNQPNRLGEAEKYVMGSPAIRVVIDHHLGSHNIAKLLISDPTVCSTAELVHLILTQINGEPFNNKLYSEAIYVGIITDTGNFEHGAYSGRTFRIVAELLDSGIEKGKIIDVVYNSFSADRMKLLGFALYQRMTVMSEYKTAYIYLTREDLAKFNHAKGDTEGFVNLPLSINGIHFAVLFIEKENFVKLSFRSKGNFPVNEFASKYFSGGGHLNASGGEYYESLENTIRYFLKVLEENAELLKGSL
jgi:bifunctional oligoribonuclease and PAP phosphatase NrnA